MPKTTIDDAIRILSERPYLPHPWILFLESARDRNLPQYYLSRLRTYKDVPAEIVTDEYSPDYDRAKGRRTHILHISLTLQKMVDEGIVADDQLKERIQKFRNYNWNAERGGKFKFWTTRQELRLINSILNDVINYVQQTYGLAQ